MGSNDYLMWWEAKYKTCRAAFVAMGRINRQEKRNDLKMLQRLQQLAFDGMQAGGPGASTHMLTALVRIRETILAHIQEKVS